MPSSVVAPTSLSWHSRSNYASLPPSPLVTMVATIFSTLIRGPIGRRHRIYYNLQRIFRMGKPSYSCPFPVVYHRTIRSGILPRGDCVGKRRSGGGGRRDGWVWRRGRWQWNEPAVEREARWTYGEKKERVSGGGKRENIKGERPRVEWEGNQSSQRLKRCARARARLHVLHVV